MQYGCFNNIFFKDIAITEHRTPAKFTVKSNQFLYFKVFFKGLHVRLIFEVTFTRLLSFLIIILFASSVKLD